ncbi:unnamed protein product, partial [Rotaria socialis]
QLNFSACAAHILMRFLWRYFLKQQKMSFATARRIPPALGQESVWDYPRPPRVENTSEHIEAIISGVVITDTRRVK